MHRPKSTACRSRMVTSSSFSSEDDISLGVCQEEVPAPSTDAAFSSTVSQRRGGMSSHLNQFTHKYEAQWKDNLSM